MPDSASVERTGPVCERMLANRWPWTAGCRSLGPWAGGAPIGLLIDGFRSPAMAVGRRRPILGPLAGGALIGAADRRFPILGGGRWPPEADP